VCVERKYYNDILLYSSILFLLSSIFTEQNRMQQNRIYNDGDGNIFLFGF
jgi:hypothetical protein